MTHYIIEHMLHESGRHQKRLQQMSCGSRCRNIEWPVGVWMVEGELQLNNSDTYECIERHVSTTEYFDRVDRAKDRTKRRSLTWWNK